MSTTVLKDMNIGDLDRIVEIDRTEYVDAFYRQTGTEIVLDPIEPFTGGWWPDVETTIAFCRGHMRRDARAIGAFDGQALIGIVMVTPDIAPAMAQLAFLHVTATWRRKGVATLLFDAAKAEARRGGHTAFYVTATPTRSAVGFYRRNGFAPTDRVIPELFALEPEDIHMVMAL